MVDEEKIVWVLGGRVPSADNSIPWQIEIPNLSNSDILIIDLNTIPEAIQGRIPWDEIRDYLRYHLMANKEIYIILSDPLETRLLPVTPILIAIKPANFLELNPLDLDEIPVVFKEYFKVVENCSFFIDYLDHSFLWNCLRPDSSWDVETYPFTPRINSFHELLLFEAMNVAHQSMGLSSRYVLKDDHGNVVHVTGLIHFLPPPTKLSSTDAIKALVNALTGDEFKEEQPNWVDEIPLSRVSDLEAQIVEKDKLIKRTIDEKAALVDEKNELDKHKKLLWTTGTPLENAVSDAFLILGFPEIREGRSKELEDWVIEIESSDEHILGVIEVKGREHKTSLNDMNQCFKWVNQYRVQEGKKVKGIFVTNQFRRSDNLDSARRSRFEPNEIEFAQDFEICVLSTSALFMAVRHVLEGNILERAEIERKILEANPICQLV